MPFLHETTFLWNMFKVNRENARTRSMTSRRSGVFIVNCGHISPIFLVLSIDVFEQVGGSWEVSNQFQKMTFSGIYLPLRYMLYGDVRLFFKINIQLLHTKHAI